MKRDIRLLFGPLAAAVLALGVARLALMVPGYSHVRQTVSEIGEAGSPAQLAITLMLCSVAACILVFAFGVRASCRAAGHATYPAYLIGFMALSAAGVGIFSFPHPLHNVFGMSELIGYQAPLALALAWRKDAKARTLVVFSWIMFVVVWIAIALNVSSLDRHGLLWSYVRPVNGLAQRALFASWFAWIAGAGAMMWRRPAKPR